MKAATGDTLRDLLAQQEAILRGKEFQKAMQNAMEKCLAQVGMSQQGREKFLEEWSKSGSSQQ